MRKFTNFFDLLSDIFKDRNFLKVIHTTENLVSKMLSMALVIVIFFSVADLIVYLFNELLAKPNKFFNGTLIEIFGFFLNILIALELLENVTVYLRKHIVQLELVLITALIAVSRKIIIFNPQKYDTQNLIAMGVAALCLSMSYWLVRYSNSKNK